MDPLTTRQAADEARAAETPEELLKAARRARRAGVMTPALKHFVQSRYIELGRQVSWTVQINESRTTSELLHVSGRIRDAGVWGPRYADLCHVKHRRLLAKEWDLVLAEDVVAPGEEAAVRLDERVKVLREVRNAVAKDYHGACDERPGHTGDPYGWGFGASKVVAYLSWKLGEARRAAGLEPPRP